MDKALSFMHGLLCGAEKLTQIAYLRRDQVVPEILGLKRMPSQSSLSRFFAVFDTAGKNLRCFGPLWQWCISKLKPRVGGFSLDFDSTRLLHEDGHQEGVSTGYTRQGIKPCLHPLFAVLEVAYWLTEGKSNAEIAMLMKIGLQTVKGHMTELFNKTGAGNRLALTLHLLDDARRGSRSLRHTVLRRSGG